MFELLEFDIIKLLVNFSYELSSIMTRYNFLDVLQFILSNVNVGTDFNWQLFANCLCELEQINFQIWFRRS